MFSSPVDQRSDQRHRVKALPVAAPGRTYPFKTRLRDRNPRTCEVFRASYLRKIMQIRGGHKRVWKDRGTAVLVRTALWRLRLEGDPASARIRANERPFKSPSGDDPKGHALPTMQVGAGKRAHTSARSSVGSRRSPSTISLPQRPRRRLAHRATSATEGRSVGGFCTTPKQ